MIETESEILIKEINRLKKLNRIVKIALYLFLLAIMISGIVYIIQSGNPMEINQTFSIGDNILGGFKI